MMESNFRLNDFTFLKKNKKMDGLKKFLGIVWLLIAVGVSYFLLTEFGWKKLTSGKQDDLVFGIIIFFVLTPFIGGGLGIFGYYSLVGEYSDDKK